MQYKKKVKVPSIFGIITGVLSFLIGITGIVVNYSASHYVSYEKYGGDAYTGIQNAAAATASNVSNLGDTVSNGFNVILVILGLAIIFFFMGNLFEMTAVSSYQFNPVPTVNQPNVQYPVTNTQFQSVQTPSVQTANDSANVTSPNPVTATYAQPNSQNNTL